MQARDCIRHAVFVNRKSQVNLRSSLRDERDTDVADEAEDARRDAGRAAQALTNNADNGALGFNVHRAERFQLCDDGRKIIRVVER